MNAYEKSLELGLTGTDAEKVAVLQTLSVTDPEFDRRVAAYDAADASVSDLFGTTSAALSSTATVTSSGSDGLRITLDADGRFQIAVIAVLAVLLAASLFRAAQRLDTLPPPREGP